MSANKIAKDIFLAAIEITGQAERDAFVSGACRGEEALFHEVAELLAAHFQKDSWRKDKPWRLVGQRRLRAFY